MLKDIDEKPKEPASVKAERKWSNNFKQMAAKNAKREEAERVAKEAKNQPPKIASVIENDHPRADNVTRAQTKFAQEIRQMLEGHTRRNLLLYKLSLKVQIRRLKLEKLRRLEAKAAQQNQGG